MNISTKLENCNLQIQFNCELDHHVAKNIKEELIHMINKNPEIKTIEFDMETLSIMDSSGIGVLISIYKIMQLRNGNIVLKNPNRTIKKVIELSGLDKILDII